MPRSMPSWSLAASCSSPSGARAAGQLEGSARPGSIAPDADPGARAARLSTKGAADGAATGALRPQEDRDSWCRWAGGAPRATLDATSAPSGPERAGHQRMDGQAARSVHASTDHLLAEPVRARRSPAKMGKGAGRVRRGIVRGCPLGTGQDRCEWHAGGTAGVGDPGIRLSRWLHPDRTVRPVFGDHRVVGESPKGSRQPVGRLELHCTRLLHPKSADCRSSDLRFYERPLTARARCCPSPAGRLRTQYGPGSASTLVIREAILADLLGLPQVRCSIL